MRSVWRPVRAFAGEFFMLLLAAIWWLPFYFLVVVALKPSQEIFGSPAALPSRPAFENFPHAWVGPADVTLGEALVNSLIITVGSVALLILLGAPAAYVLARRSGRLSTSLYFGFVFGIILPSQLGIVPAYVALREVGLAGTHVGLILLYAALLMPLTVFLYTGFVRTIPHTYEEAAQIDGAGLFRTFRRVVFPLMYPVTGTVAILTGLIVWNDFFLPLIFLNGTTSATLPVFVFSFVGEFASQWNLVFAAVIVSLAPMMIFYAVAQRHLIRGFGSGIKA